MREKYYQDKIREGLKERGWWVQKYHGSVYGTKGFSDLFGMTDTGRPFFHEVKRPGAKLRPEQEVFLREVARRGADTGVWYGMIFKPFSLSTESPLTAKSS